MRCVVEILKEFAYYLRSRSIFISDRKMTQNPTTSFEEGGSFVLNAPDITISVKQQFGIDSELEVPAFSEGNEYVPLIDDAYRFDPVSYTHLTLPTNREV